MGIGEKDADGVQWRECHGSTPMLGDDGKAVWALTPSGQVCGKWRSMGVGNALKDLTDEEVVAEVDGQSKEMIQRQGLLKLFQEEYSGVPMVAGRDGVVDAIVDRKRVSRVRVLDRIRSLVRRGLLEDGSMPDAYLEMADLPRFRACVWLPGSNGSGSNFTAREKVRVKQKRLDRADLQPQWERVREILAAACPDKDRAKSLRELLAACQKRLPALKHSTLHRFLRRRVLDRQLVVGEKGGYWIAPGANILDPCPQPPERYDGQGNPTEATSIE